MWEEVLKTDTHAGRGPAGRLVGDIVDGTAQGHSDTAIVGVANLGNADNLTGHHFSQANLFAFGRQAWDWKLDSGDIAEDWVRMTWSDDDRVVRTIVKMMMGSWEALVSYQTPLGIGHQFRSSDHYGPKPDEFFIKDDWSPVYYNQADSAGLGYDRSPTGSNFTAQYFPPLERRYGEHRDDAREPAHVVPPRAVGPPDGQRQDLLGRAGLPLPDGRAIRDLDARDMGLARAVHRCPPLRRGEGEAREARGRRRRLAGHLRELLAQFSGRPIPVDGGPLSIKIVVGGKRFGGFDLSRVLHDPGRAVASRITKVIPPIPRALPDRLPGGRTRRRQGQGTASSGRS